MTRTAEHRDPRLRVGEIHEVLTRAMVHGGHCLAAVGSKTVFVRHALPGERVRIRITEVRSKFARADAIEVLDSSEYRVPPPCALAGTCGGCDLQHADPVFQRELKSRILRESLVRHGHLEPSAVAGLEVEEVPGGSLGWRQRVRWSADDQGRPALHAHRSDRLVPIADCLIASPAQREWLAAAPGFPGADAIVTTDDEGGGVQVVVDGDLLAGPARVRRSVGERIWRLGPDTFWQGHSAAAAVLAQCVLDFAEPMPGQHWWDLYAGAGLFTAFLAEAVGRGGSVDAVEGSESAVRDARRALHDLPQAALHLSGIAPWVREQRSAPDGVVLDPPRSGAGAEVLEPLMALVPRRIVLIGCDPVAMARDIGLLHAYRVDRIRAFDLFPMTHHMEAVAALTREDGPAEIS